MATLTPNLGLTLPAGDENVSRQVINDNMMIIDNAAGNNSSLDAMQEGLTNIVDGDTTDEAIPAGAYAYLKNNTHGLAEGYYQNISGSAFPTSGGTADITTFAPVSTAGILNSLNNNTFRKPDFTRVLHSVSPNGSEQSYTMPEDGFVNCYGWGPSNNTGFANLRPAGTTGLNINFGWAQGGQIFGGVCYASKGDVVAFRGASGVSGAMIVYGLK